MRRRVSVAGVLTDLHHGVFYFTLLVLGLYAVGNFQAFLDETQLMLLGVARNASLAGVFVGVYAAVGRVLAPRTQTRRVVYEVVVLIGNTTVFVALTGLSAWLGV